MSRETKMVLTTRCARFRRSVVLCLIPVMCLCVLLTTQLARAGTFTDGDATIQVAGTLFVSASPYWTSAQCDLNANLAGFPNGVPYVASAFDELNQTSATSGSTYEYVNLCDVLISGEVRVGNGSASVDLLAEAATSASLSSSDHGGVPVNNTTNGSVQVFGSMNATFITSTSYSVMATTSVPTSGQRYVEGTGGTISKQEIDSGGATSSVTAPAGVPGEFSDADTATNLVSVQLTILYGPGATQDNPVGPTGAPARLAT